MLCIYCIEIRSVLYHLDLSGTLTNLQGRDLFGMFDLQ